MKAILRVNPPDKDNVILYIDIVWDRTTEEAHLFENTMLLLDVNDEKAVVRRREYRDTWRKITACRMLDILGGMNKQGLLWDIRTLEEEQELKDETDRRVAS